MRVRRLALISIFLSLPLAAEEKTIPLLISEHHADHMEFFFRHSGNDPAAMIVLDAHADTVANEQSNLIRGLAAAGNYLRAGELAGNHNWIHPLAPSPLESLYWISTIRGSPRSDKQYGFLNSVSKWNEKIPAVFLSVDELRFLEVSNETLFVSVDLDFFYSENHGPEDVPAILDSLFSFTSRRQGPFYWAVCLSRPWLPGDSYAWTLLEQTLNWLDSRPEFNAPEISLFDDCRTDTSLKAQAYRSEGREMPFLQEKDAPEYIRTLIRKLVDRK